MKRNDDDSSDSVVMLIEKESNVLNYGSAYCAEVDELGSDDSCDSNSDHSDALRKMLINKEVCDAICSSSQVNCLFNAMKQSDVSMKAGSKHHKLIVLTDVMIDNISKFASECYELNTFDSFHSNFINSLV